MKLPNFTRPLYGVGEIQTFFIFFQTYIRSFRIHPKNFTNIWQIVWNWIRSMKFETVQILFLSDVFGLLLFRNFPSMATWRNDFSCALSQESSLGPDSAVGAKSEKKKLIGERSEPSSSLPSPPLSSLRSPILFVVFHSVFCLFSPQRGPRLQDRRGKTIWRHS